MMTAAIRSAFRPPALGLWPPRRTVRLRLTVAYGGLFLLTGAVLLAITYFLVARNMPPGPRIVRGLTTRLAPPPGVPRGTVVFRAGTGRCHLLARPHLSAAQLAARLSDA
jgi:hypothetical protein